MNAIAMITGAAPAAPTLALSTTSVTNLASEIKLRSFAPGSDLKLLDACQRRFDRVARSRAGRPLVYRYRPDDLFARDAMAVAAIENRKVVGTLHYHKAASGMTIRGMAVDPAQSGRKLGSAMAALAIVHGWAMYGAVPAIECVIRVREDGSLNEPSRASFQKLGFILLARTGRADLTGRYEDRVLFETAETNPFDASVFVRYRTMMAAGPEVYEVARAFLAHWSHAVLPLAPRRLGR